MDLLSALDPNNFSSQRARHVSNDIRINLWDFPNDQILNIALVVEQSLERYRNDASLLNIPASVFQDIEILEEIISRNLPPLSSVINEASKSVVWLIYNLTLLASGDFEYALYLNGYIKKESYQKPASKHFIQKTKHKRGGEKSGYTRKENQIKRNEDICKAARERLEKGISQRDLSSILGSRFKLSNRSIRDILKRNKIYK